MTVLDSTHHEDQQLDQSKKVVQANDQASAGLALEIIETIDEVFYCLDTNWCFTYLNSKAEQLWGRTYIDLIGKNIWLEFADSVNTQTYHEMHRAMRDKQPVHFEMFSSFLGIWVEIGIYPSATRLVVNFRDISARKAAEVALKDVQDQLRQITDALPLFFSYVDPQLRYVYANKGYEQMIGLDREQIIGRSVKDVVGSTTFETIEAGLRAALRGETIHYERETVYASGTHFIRSQLIPHNLADGSLGGIIVLMDDITEIRHSEARLADLAAIITSSNDAIISKTLDGIITNWNPAAERIFGYTADEALQKPITILFPPDRMAEETFFLQKIAAGESIQNYDTVRLRKDGAEINIAVSLSPIKDKQGRIIGLSNIVRDITQRKLEEMQLRQSEATLNSYAQRMNILHKIDNGILNATTMETLVSGALAQIRSFFNCEQVGLTLFDFTTNEGALFAYSTTAEISGLDDTLVELPPNFKDIIGTESVVALDDLQTYLAANPSLRRPALREMRSSLLAFLRFQGELTGVIILNSKKIKYFTTDQREVAAEIAAQLSIAIRQMRLSEGQVRLAAELEHKVAERTAQLLAVNQELDAFAYVISHDLKAPLRGITQISSWLVSDYGDRLDAEGRKLLNLLLGRSKRMHAMIEGVLLYSRIGRIGENPTKVDLNKLVAETVDLLATPDGIQISVAPDLPIIVGDETRIRQVFQNLISNAIKYMGKANGTIVISYADKETDWQFAIADDGPGIAPIYHEKIFQIFQTLTRRDEVEGTGIGLSLVKRIVELHGGRVWVDSMEGQGATFYFTLPKA